MTIRDLEIFVEVVRTKNMSEAAKNLSISQPTVSHAISQIEREYSVTLFDRISKRLYITDVGLKLYHFSIDLIEKFDDIIIFLQSSSKKYDLNLGLSAHFSSDFLLNTIFEYEKNHKDFKIKTSVKSKNQIIKETLTGFVNLGIIEGDVFEDGCECLKLYEDNLSLIVNKNHRLANLKEVSLKDINGECFVLGELDDDDKKNLLRILKEHKVFIDLKFTCQNNDMVMNIVRSGEAVTFGSKILYNSKDLCALPLKGIELKRSYNLIFKRDKKITPALQEFIDFIGTKLN